VAVLYFTQNSRRNPDELDPQEAGIRLSSPQPAHQAAQGLRQGAEPERFVTIGLQMEFGMRHAILISLLLMGCSTSDPIRVGDNRYVIYTTNYTGFSTRAGQIQRAMDDANDFCAKRGKVAQLQSDNGQGQPAMTPVSANVVFTCVTAEH
jgi:hypothetical protein